ncbi:MAG: diacylglycerol/lipid kinase family protein [Christensenellaceae bacterium]
MMLLIVNPVAGHGKAMRLADKASSLLGNCRTVYTHAPGHATELAREAAKAGVYEAVVAMGGDGTVSETAAGLRDTALPLGILPAGTGNDTCRGYGIPLGLEQAVEVLRRGARGRVDILRVNGRIFLNIMSVGFDAQVVKAAQQYKSFGSVSYAMGVYAALTRYRYTELTLTVDGATQQGRYYLVAAGCGTHYGGGMNVLPMADPCDGLLDLCTIEPVSTGTVLRLLPRFMKGQHPCYDFVHFSRARHIVIEAGGADGFDLNADGEIQPGQRRVEISVLPRGQLVILPEAR